MSDEGRVDSQITTSSNYHRCHLASLSISCANKSFNLKTNLYISGTVILHLKRERVLSSIIEEEHQKIAIKATVYYCTGLGNKNIMQYYLKKYHNAELNKATPLMAAVRKRNESTISLLLSRGASLMTLNIENKSALQVFCEEQTFSGEIANIIFYELCKRSSTYEEVAQRLIDAGCHLYQACYFRSVEVLEYMLKHNYSVNSAHSRNKMSALHVAVVNEDVEIVKLLLKHGANINALDKRNQTPLNYIYKYGREHTNEKIEILKSLLNLQVSLTSCNSVGFFQVTPTLMDGNRDSIRLVLQSNIDFTAKDQNKKCTVLHHLAFNTNPGVVEELKPYINKYDVNVVCDLGISPLHMAAGRRNVDFVQFLLEQGARPNCTHNEYGYTPLYFAYLAFKPSCKRQCDKTIELLAQNDADPQIMFTKKNQQLTIFDIAEKTNSVNRMKPLIAHLVKREGLGVPITEITSAKINSYPRVKKYFDRCQKLVKKKICGSVTLLKLLTGSKRKMARYSGNKQLLLKLIRLSYKKKLNTSHSYYYNTVKKRLMEGITYKKFLDEVGGVISKIFEHRFDKTHLIVDKMIDCLTDESLLNLHQLSKSVAISSS